MITKLASFRFVGLPKIRIIRGPSRRLVPPEPCAKAEAPRRRRIEKFSPLEIFRELRREFPGVDSEWQNNYPKGTTQIESNNTYEHINPNSN